MADLLEGLNEAQKEAVTSTEGMVRVIAGAGSGKTRALSRRFAFLVNEIGILPGNILCVTFTNKSANEMRQRIHNLTGDNDTGYINTFHGFCVSVLQEDSYAIQYPKSFLVLDNSDIDAMLKMIYEERGLTLRDMTFSHAREMIEMMKLKERPQYYLDMLSMSPDVLYQKYMEAGTVKEILFYGYLYQERKCFGLDYDDLIQFCLYLFDQHEAIRLKWQKRLEYIMVDEFQDIDAPQYELLEILCAYHKNLFVVGDPDQTIYSWRGADGKYLMEFDKAFSGVKTIFMMQNYRSSPEILAAANSLIAVNCNRIKKDLLPTMEHGEKVSFYHGKNTEEEALWIAKQIGKRKEAGAAYRDICILYRAHYVTRAVEEALLKEEIPYTIYSGVQFFGRMEIKDALSYLRMIVYQDDLSFLRIANVPRRNLGERRMNFLKEYVEEKHCSYYQALCWTVENPIFKGTKAAQFISLIEFYSANYRERQISQLFTALMEDSGYEKMLRTEGNQERLDNLAELKQSIYEYETTCGEESMLEHYLTHVALFTNSDGKQDKDQVKLMTVHAAKGLEFPYVFLCGMNEGIFPSRKIRSRAAMEEERRLAFVAVTRGKRGLYMTGAQGRNLDGSPRYPSRFVLDMDPETVEFVVPLREGLVEETREYVHHSDRWLEGEGAQETFPEDTRVVHPIFGIGTVLERDLVQGAYLIQFDEMETPRSISFKVRLEAAGEEA
jgi:DNA helicase-2/ATP-dependent DNA helicase PcrA